MLMIRIAEFAQVEFTAVLATILTKYRIVPAAKNDINEDAAREKIVSLIRDSNAHMVVQFAEPEELWIKLVER